MSEGTSEGEQPAQATAWWVYGIVPADATLPEFGDNVEGQLGQRDFELLVQGQVAAVVEAQPVDRPARRQDLLAHSGLLNALAEHVPVVPVTFGSAFEERDDVVAELLVPHESSLASMLDQLRGHAEFVLRMRYEMDDLLARIVAADGEIAALRERTRALPEGTGTSDQIRLGELVSHAVEAWQADDTDWLLAQLESSTADFRVTSRSTSEASVSLAFLVAHSRRAEFEAAAEECAAQLAERARLELQGPLAAFDFVPEG